jgi:hypothetical protein
VCDMGVLAPGDNRDATYITSWPLVTLARPGQVLLVAGVNHAFTGGQTQLVGEPGRMHPHSNDAMCTSSIAAATGAAAGAAAAGAAAAGAAAAAHACANAAGPCSSLCVAFLQMHGHVLSPPQGIHAAPRMRANLLTAPLTWHTPLPCTLSPGSASYTNLGLADPLRQLGLAALDDAQLGGPGAAAAGRVLAGSAHSWAAPGLYVGAFARNCSWVEEVVAGSRVGQVPCKEVGSRGARGAPLAAPLLIMGRAYVHPATGVGPPGSSLVMMHAMVMTPRGVAGPGDSRPPLPREVLAAANSTCLTALLRHAQCSAEMGMAGAQAAGSGVSSSSSGATGCCAASQTWWATGCSCSEAGKALLQGPSPLLGAALLREVAERCGVVPRRPGVVAAAGRVVGGAAGGLNC